MKSLGNVIKYRIYIMQRTRGLLHRHINLAKWMVLKRCCSQSTSLVPDVVERSNQLFTQEQKRQLEEVGRIEKITVQVEGPPEDVTLAMNQNLSTPYECARHISLPLVQQAALALLDDQILWDMHRPLPGNCKLKFLTFKDKDPYSLNKAFWRTGSFVLGAVIKRAFKEHVAVYLHSFPPPNVRTGSFVYDAHLGVKNWLATEDECKVMSAEFLSFVHENHKIERLSVKKSVAFEIFEGNPIKQRQIPQIAAAAEDKLITLYRVGDHIDISKGPMVADTSFFGRCAVAAVHRMETDEGEIYRFQAVALPKGIMLNSAAFSCLLTNACRLNETNLVGCTDTKVPFSTKPKVQNQLHEFPD